MKKILISGLVLSLMLSGSLLARPGKGGKSFRGHDGMHQRDGIRMILRLSDDINLSQEQEATLEKMATDFQVERIDLEAEIKKAQVALKATMKDKKASEGTVYGLIDKVSNLKADAKKMKYRHQQIVKEVLTEEQLGQLEDFKDDPPKGRRFGDRTGDCDGEGPHGHHGKNSNKHFGR